MPFELKKRGFTMRVDDVAGNVGQAQPGEHLFREHLGIALHQWAEQLAGGVVVVVIDRVPARSGPVA
jgi:hypothetical protein